MASIPMQRWMQPPVFWQAEAGHLLLVQQVINALMDVAEAIYLLAGEVGSGCHYAIILGVLSQVVGLIDDIDAGGQPGVIPAHQLPVDVDIVPHLEKLVSILLRGSHGSVPSVVMVAPCHRGREPTPLPL